MIMSMDQVLAAFKEGKITSEEVLQYAEKEKKLMYPKPIKKEDQDFLPQANHF